MLVTIGTAVTAGPGAAVLTALGAADLRLAGIFVLCLVAAISVHEFSHAFVAHKLGDPTPDREGRLTLNPVSHADPIGTLALPVILALFSPGFLFGWGRPVPTQPRHYTRRVSMRAGMAMVSLAGPLSNLLLAALTILVVWALSAAGVVTSLPSHHPLRTFFNLNIILFVFNLLPIHPLDGGKVLAWALGTRYQHIDDFLLRYGQIVLIVLIVLPPGRLLLNFILSPFYMVGNAALNAVF